MSDYHPQHECCGNSFYGPHRDDCGKIRGLLLQAVTAKRYVRETLSRPLVSPIKDLSKRPMGE